MRSGPIPLKKADLFGKEHNDEKTHQYGVMLVLIGATLWGSSSNSLEYLMTYQHFSWDTVLAIRMFVTAAVFLLISGLRGEKLLDPVKRIF